MLTRYQRKVLHWSLFLNAFLSEMSPISIPESWFVNEAHTHTQNPAYWVIKEGIRFDFSQCLTCFFQLFLWTVSIMNPANQHFWSRTLQSNIKQDEFWLQRKYNICLFLSWTLHPPCVLSHLKSMRVTSNGEVSKAAGWFSSKKKKRWTPVVFKLYLHTINELFIYGIKSGAEFHAC